MTLINADRVNADRELQYILFSKWRYQTLSYPPFLEAKTGQYRPSTGDYASGTSVKVPKYNRKSYNSLARMNSEQFGQKKPFSTLAEAPY